MPEPETNKGKAARIIREANALSGGSDLEDDLDHDYRHDLVVDAHRRLDRLESGMASGQHPAETTLERGERILAKAQEMGQQLMTPEGILAKAQEVMTNPIDLGVVRATSPSAPERRLRRR